MHSANSVPITMSYNSMPSLEQPRNMTGIYLGLEGKSNPPWVRQSHVPPLARGRGISHRPKTPAEERRHKLVESLRIKEEKRGFTGQPLKKHKPTPYGPESYMSKDPSLKSVDIAGNVDDISAFIRTNPRQFTAANNSGVRRFEYLGDDMEMVDGIPYPDCVAEEVHKLSLTPGGLIGLNECYRKVCNGSLDSLHALFRHRRMLLPHQTKYPGFIVKSYQNPQAAELLADFSLNTIDHSRPVSGPTPRPLVPRPYFFRHYGPNPSASDLYMKSGVGFYPSLNSCVHIVASPGAGKISQPLQKRRQHWLPSFHQTVIQEYSGYRPETQEPVSEIRAPVSVSRDLTPVSKSSILYIPREKSEAESTSLLSPVTGKERGESTEEAVEDFGLTSTDHIAAGAASVPVISDLPVSDKRSSEPINLPPAGTEENTHNRIAGYQENNLAELSFHSETRPTINQDLPSDSNTVLVMIKSVPRPQPGPLSTGSTATGATMNSPSEPTSIQIGLEDERGESKAVEIDTAEQEEASKVAGDDLDETAKGKKRSITETVEKTRESEEAMIASIKENAELRQKELEQLLNEHAELVQEIGRASSSENINIEQKG